MQNKFIKKFVSVSLSAVMIFSAVSFNTEAKTKFEIKLDELSPAFQKYVQEQKSRNASNVLVDGHALGYIPSPIEFKRNYSTPSLRRSLNNSLPEDYTSTAEGLVTSVKNQGDFGSCWSFGTTAAFESSYMKQNGLSTGALEIGPIDYSEMNMVYNLNKGTTIDNPYEFDFDKGGNNEMVAAYLASGRGAVLEKNDRYKNGFDGSWKVLKREYLQTKLKPQDKYTREIIFIPNPDNDNETSKENHRTLVKKYIMEFGSVATSFYWDSDYVTDDMKNYYYNEEGCEHTNHLVNIIGWDDNYPKENFENFASGIPEHDGAFIIKNSWGKDFHDGGFFYMSYDDIYAGAEAFAVTDIVDTQEKYQADNIYQKDYFGMTLSIQLGLNQILECKTFDLKSESENLTDVGLFTASNNINCEIYLANLDSSGKPIGLGEKLGEQFFELPGYHTITLSNVINLNKNNTLKGKFGIIIKMSSNENISLPCEIKYEDFSSKAKGYANENFVNENGTDWEDVYFEADSITFTNLNIKAFTEKTTPVLTPVVNQGGGGSYSILENTETKKTDDKIEADTHDKNESENKNVNAPINLLNKLKTSKYISGYSDKTFKPNNSITNAEMKKIISNLTDDTDISSQAINISSNFEKVTRSDAAQILYEIADKLSKHGIDFGNTSDKINFVDVSENKTAIEFLVSHNVINGYGNNKFMPNNSVTRAEFVAMISKMFGRTKVLSETISFNDVPKNFWAYDYIMNAANGI